MRWNGYGSIPIDTIFSGMNIHLPAILMWTTGVPGFWPIPKWVYRVPLYSSSRLNLRFITFPKNLIGTHWGCQETSLENRHGSSLTKATKSRISRHEAGSKRVQTQNHLKYSQVSKFSIPSPVHIQHTPVEPCFSRKVSTYLGCLAATKGASKAASCRSSPSPGGWWPPWRSSWGGDLSRF